MNRSLLMKATSAEDEPTPGYLYGEIAKMTFEGLDVAEKVTKFLVERLQRKEPPVRLKALIVTKHVCRRGDPSFRRSIQAPGNISVVKSCLQFTGPADPLKGDQPYRAVREAAKDALEAIFDNTSDVTPANSALAQRIQGYGGSASSADSQTASTVGSSYYDDSAKMSGFGNSVPSSSYGGGRSLPSESSYSSSAYSRPSGGGNGPRYEGIGNPNFKDPRNQPKGFLERVKDRVEEYTEKASKSVATSGIQEWLGAAKVPGVSLAGSRDFDGYGIPDNTGTYQGVTSFQTTPSTSSGFKGLNSGSGGAWAPPSNHSSSLSASSDPRSPRPGNYGRQTGSSSSDGTYERGLVDELCSRGGVRAVPAREKVESFLSACKTLKAEVVMPLLYEKLKSRDWKVQNKALIVCEGLIQAGEELEAYVDYLDVHADILEELKSSSQPTLKAKATKVWVLLYGTEYEEDVDESTETKERHSTPQSVPATTTRSQETNLLEFDDTSSTNIPESGSTSTNASHSSVNGGVGLFGNMQVKEQTEPSGPPANSGFSFLQPSQENTTPPPSTPTQTQNNEEDLMYSGEEQHGQAESGTLVDQLAGLSFSTEAPAAPGNTAFPFMSQSHAAPPQPVKNDDNIGNAFDSLMQNNLGHRQNPIPTQPNSFLPRAGVNSTLPVNNVLNPKPLKEMQSSTNIPFPQTGMQGVSPELLAQLNNPAFVAMMLQQQQQQIQQMQQMQGGVSMQMNPQLAMMLQQQQMMQQQFAQQQQQQQFHQMRVPQHSNPAMKKHVPSTKSASTGNGLHSAQQGTKQPDKFDFVSSAMAEMK